VANLLWYLERLDDWLDIVDILLVAVIFFWVLYMVRGTRAVPLLRGVILLVIVVALLGSVIRLRAFSWLIQNAIPALLVAIPVLFQQELRRALERLGRAGFLLGWAKGERADLEQMLEALSQASHKLSERRSGALIVLERETGLQELADSGILLDAAITPELLLTTFNPNTVLHDGAVIIRSGRVLAAACVLPLSTAFLADRELGLRHRAAIGVTEESDAIVIVISEESGTISIAHNGRIIRNLDSKRLEAVLRALYQPALELSWPRWVARVRQIFTDREQ